MAEDNWLVIEGAKVCLTKMDLAAAEFLMSALGGNIGRKISRWNKYAVARKGGYDAETVRHRWRAPSTMARLMGRYLQDGQEILDIGCGSGLVKEAFSKREKSRNLVFDGVDFSTEMLRKSRAKGYRNLFCADVGGSNLPEAIWFDLGFVQKYPVVISVGVYGDFVNQNRIPLALELAADRSVVGIAGRETDLGNAGALLKDRGFSILRQESSVAHLDYPLQENDPEYAFARLLTPEIVKERSVKKIRYNYIIAKR